MIPTPDNRTTIPADAALDAVEWPANRQPIKPRNIFSGPIKRLSWEEFGEVMHKFSVAPEPENFPQPGTPAGDELGRWYAEREFTGD
jgi:hypothetical protein